MTLFLLDHAGLLRVLFNRSIIGRILPPQRRHSQGFHSSNNIATPDEDSPHIIGTAGNEMWATGRWSATIQGKHWGPIPANGYWSVIREGDDWKIRMLAFNIAPPPAATPSPTTTPSNQ